jgi:hypothetical protein
MKNAHTGLLAAFLHDKKSEKNTFFGSICNFFQDLHHFPLTQII